MFSQEHFRAALMKWVIISMQPFTEIEQPSFVEMIKTLNPSAHVVSNDTIKNDILKLFDTELNKIKILLNVSPKSPGLISFSHDEWTSKFFLPFMAVRAHWINNDWKYCEKLIDFALLDGQHTGSNLFLLFEKSLEQIRLPLQNSFV